MTDNDKADELKMENNAREIPNRMDAPDQSECWCPTVIHSDACPMSENNLLRVIDSQRLALDEKDKEIAALDNIVDSQFIALVRKQKEISKWKEMYEQTSADWNHEAKERKQLIEQLQREVEMFKAGLQAADDKLIEVQGENTRLQSRVKELEANQYDPMVHGSTAAKQGADAVIESWINDVIGKPGEQK